MKEHAARVDEGERGHGAPGHHGSDGRTHGSSRIQQLLIVLLSVAGLGCAMNMEGGEADPAADAPAPFQEDDAIYDQAEVQAAYAEPSAPDASDDSIGSSQAAIQNGYVSTHSDGLVRFDFSGGGRCSGFLVGPNMITTAAHCVDDQILSQYSRGTAGGMKWGYIYARVVYKPGNEGTFCLNRACREDGETRYMYFRAWFDAGYSGTGDTASDFAIVTALEGTDFVTYPDDDWEPAPRALNSSDYLRVLRHQVPTSQWLYAWGYGRLNDSTTTVTPHWGPLKLNYWGPSHVRGDAGTDTARRHARAAVDRIAHAKADTIAHAQGNKKGRPAGPPLCRPRRGRGHALQIISRRVAARARCSC